MDVMKIRESEPRDIPQIIEVLKASLGETFSKKTEEAWRYKHIDNPFGKSLVLVAVENDNIIGVRAFMRWKWQLGNQIFSTWRAVDTATHPKHQRKGVFNKLTLNAIGIAKDQGSDFIFNTPNSQSLPGYLKMGWKEVTRLKIRIFSSNPLNWFNVKQTGHYGIYNNSSNSHIAELTSKYNYLKAEENKLFTLKSPEYLIWRYEINPLQNYEVYGDEDFYLAGHIKEHKYFKELRITEHIYYNDSGLKKIHKAVKEISKKFGAHIISSTGLGSGLGFSGNFGPILTYKALNLNKEHHSKLENLNNWNYSLGDLELF